MKNTKKYKALVIALAVLAVVASVSSVLAYMVKKSVELNNQFDPAVVDCDIKETFDGNVKSSVKVQNTSNIKAYVRIRIVTYWQDSKGNIVGMTAPEIKFGTDWKYDTTKWVYDEEEKTFYYKTPIAAGELTSELFAQGFAGIELEKKPVDFNGEIFTYHPVVTFVAEAIQSQPAEAVLNWNVTLDSNGNINGIKS